MIFSVNNGEYTVWLPIYSLNPNLSIFLEIGEFTLSLAVMIFSSVTSYTIASKPAFHPNLNILIFIVIFSWSASAIGRLFIKFGTWQFSGNFSNINCINSTAINNWWTSDVTKMTSLGSPLEAWPLFMGGAFTWYYMILLNTCLLFISIERRFATWLIENYENTARVYLRVLLIFGQQILIFSLVYVTFFNLINFLAMAGFLVAMNIFATWLFVGNRFTNLRILREFDRNSMLPVRFQAMENLRVFDLTLRIFLVGFIGIIFVFTCVIILVFDFFPEFDIFIVYFFDNMIHLNPLVTCPVLIFSVSTWSKALLRLSWISKFNKMTSENAHKVHPKPTQQQETDTYFLQLNKSWE
ncbi:G_PROTEIN_RECEP_F1_2 domain-containing protein [Caenorhabditis elegans]|uniref:G_PROTEIN_RECEP_F1_2 domain-containing protein n=1 Tax=Caenorhabditis elegans TaxID=6239 RepID=A3QMA9_CAEEL|nr:G_PROTEIN_RECEP_F1_2 domain-containing protein [Caenorhabditis elegans]CAM36341.1 G_PROTEIN_RECEP_F1_2 domain-containing protein [Caenorhabditis elegans]|eukprot:NP_496612.2 Serpentine Receptor, class E (epsilon) [Caenorhabditis elegans]